MAKILATILILYGVAGVIASYLAYQRLHGLITDVRDILGALAVRVSEAGAAAKQAGMVLIERGKPAMVDVAKTLRQVSKPVGETATVLGDAGRVFQRVGTAFGAFTIPVPVPVKDTLDLDVSVNLVSGISFTQHEVLGFKVYGPPMNVNTREYTVLDLGTIDIITGLRIEDTAPLETVGTAFGTAAGVMGTARDRLSEAGAQINETQRFIEDEGVPAMDDTAEQLTSMGAELRTAGGQLSDLSQSPLLVRIPKAVLYYFALMHVAFAVTGVAILFV